MKHLIFPVLLIFLCSCSSLDKKASQLEVGSSRKDVLQVMGSAPYRYTQEGVDAWRYAVVAGFGYCDYREFYIYRDVVIYINEYHRASIAGCTVGLKDIDWGPILAQADGMNRQDPKSGKQSTKVEVRDIVQELEALQALKDSGDLSESEHTKAKQYILDN